MGAEQNMQKGTFNPEGVGERIDYPLWDECIVNNNDSEVSLFKIPKGQVGNGFTVAKKLNNTNMGSTGIPNGQRFKCFVLRGILNSQALVVTDVMLRLLRTFLRNTTLEIKIPGKDFQYQIRLDMLFGQQFNFDVVPAVTQSTAQLQQIRAPGMILLNNPITLAALTDFEAFLRYQVAPGTTIGPTDNTGFIFTFMMDGYLERLA
jgi:hypothetical protein